MTVVDDFYTIEELPDLGQPTRPTGNYQRDILPRGDGQSMEYTRASTIGGMLSDGTGLGVWTKYRAVWGAAQRDDLIARLRAVDRDDKVTIREVCQTAEIIGATEEGANWGTAAHAALQRIDEGCDISEIHEYFHPLVHNYREALRDAGITVLPQYIERTVRCARYDISGHPDNIYRLDDGTHVIGDKKTTQDIEKSERSIASQLAIYANSEHMMNYETGQYEPMPLVRKDFALIVLISMENFTVTLERIDVQYGWARTRLAIELRESNKVKGIRHPYIANGHWDPKPKTVLPTTNGYDRTTHAAQLSEKLAAAAQAGPVGAPDASPTPQVATRPTPQPPATVGPHHTEVAPPRVDTSTTGFTPPIDPEAEALELVEAYKAKPKSELQAYASRYGITDLAHHKIYIARLIVAERNKRRTQGLPSEPDDKINSSQNYGGENTPPDRPRTMAETGLPPAPAQPPGQPVVDLTADSVLAEIRSAPNLDKLNDIWTRWTDAYGRDAWLGEVQETADARAKILRAQLAGDNGPPF